jgi:DNA polymerase-3 subunit gamma/tau
MDVIEIDAASHGLVEDARDLVMRALTAPAELRRRVYVIDEVHMLSPHAFNALLKLIEEPPPHVVFVLATTDTHKVPATIISRTQRFDFRRIQADAIVGKLTRIVAAEGAEADPDALALIARLADGGMRDAESLLDQVLSYAGDRVGIEAVREAVGLADESAIAALVDALEAGDARAALDHIESFGDVGRDMGQVAAQAQEEARRRLLSSAGDPGRARRLAAVLRTLAEAAGVGAREGRARLAMELLAVDSLDAARPVPQARPTSQARPSPEPMPVNPVRVDPEPAQPLPVATRPVPAAADPAPAPPTEAAAAAPAPAAVAPATKDAAPGDVAGVRTRWATVVDAASPAIKPLLRECRPVALDGVRLTLAFPEERRFMREKAATRAGAIESLLGEILGGSWAIDCIASNVELEPLTVVQAVAPDPADPDAAALLEGVLRITGGELVDAPEVR